MAGIRRMHWPHPTGEGTVGSARPRRWSRWQWRSAMAAALTTIPEQTAAEWTETLGASRDRLLAAARTGRHGAAVLAHAAAGRMVAAWTLDPASIDPVAHLEQTHARGRRHLRRLLDQPAGAEVRSPMTSQLFDRLTQPADPTKRRPIDYTSVESYTYTPRKPLRRVLDHALDHLNQIDQWQCWRRGGRRSLRRAPRRGARHRRRPVDRVSRSVRHVLRARGGGHGSARAGTRARRPSHVRSAAPAPDRSAMRRSTGRAGYSPPCGSGRRGLSPSAEATRRRARPVARR